MIIKKKDKNNFISMFDTDTGMYYRTGILDEKGNDTGIDPFMASYPELIDIGIMNKCVCAHKCNVDCYQKAINRTGNNMSIEDYRSIMEQSKGKLMQCALGGAGDVDTHENFEEILKMTREYNIVPNFTTSGIMMTKEKAEICKKYCGAVAVSDHQAEYTYSAIKMLLDAGVTTNIHYVLGKNSIERAINNLKNNGFPKGINAVVFLIYKPVGLGKIENVLQPDDPKVKEFFELVDKNNYPFEIGFDSCAAPGLVDFTKNTDFSSIDFCEGARFSCYIDSNMNMMPCSFANQDPSWHISLKEYSIQEAWDSELFDKFRYSLHNSCSRCKHRDCCRGGCPLVNEIALCNSSEKDTKIIKTTKRK